MSKIIVRNTCILITDYNLGDCRMIENQFMIYDRITHNAYPFGMYYDEEYKVLFIPKVDISWVEKSLGIFDSTEYQRGCDEFDYIEGGVGLKYAPRDDDQKEALRFMTGAAEYSNYKNAKQLSVCLGTGKGKTYLAIAATAYYEMKSIIITYSVNWLNQWADRITEYTDIQKKDIKMINGSAAINKILKAKSSPKYKVYLVTHSTLSTYASANGWEAVGELFQKIRVGLKIIDEAHLNFANISMIDFFTNTFKTYYLTATPARSSEEENAIYNKYFKNVPYISLFDEEIDPHTRYIALKFNSHPSIYDVRECRNAYGLDRNKYIDYLTNQPEYEKLLTIILDLALKNEGKCLIYIGTNKAIAYTARWIKVHYPELYDNIGIFTTLVSKEEKEAQKEKKIILSTTKSAGAAMDIKGLKMTVVLNEPFKSHVLAQQSLGRTRDSDTFYIECVDIGFSQIRKYYYYKRPVFDKYALSCSDLPMRESELNARYERILAERGMDNEIPIPFISWGMNNIRLQFISWNIDDVKSQFINWN